MTAVVEAAPLEPAGVRQFVKLHKRSDVNHELNLRRWYMIAWGPRYRRAGLV